MKRQISSKRWKRVIAIVASAALAVTGAGFSDTVTTQAAGSKKVDVNALVPGVNLVSHTDYDYTYYELQYPVQENHTVSFPKSSSITASKLNSKIAAFSAPSGMQTGLTFTGYTGAYGEDYSDDYDYDEDYDYDNYVPYGTLLKGSSRVYTDQTYYTYSEFTGGCFVAFLTYCEWDKDERKTDVSQTVYQAGDAITLPETTEKYKDVHYSELLTVAPDGTTTKDSKYDFAANPLTAKEGYQYYIFGEGAKINEANTRTTYAVRPGVSGYEYPVYEKHTFTFENGNGITAADINAKVSELKAPKKKIKGLKYNGYSRVSDANVYGEGALSDDTVVHDDPAATVAYSQFSNAYVAFLINDGGYKKPEVVQKVMKKGNKVSIPSTSKKHKNITFDGVLLIVAPDGTTDAQFDYNLSKKPIKVKSGYQYYFTCTGRKK